MSTRGFWIEFDNLFREMDKFFERMDRLFEEAKSVNSKVHIDNPDEHKVRFKAFTWKERVKFTWQFFCMTVSMVFKGKSTVVFKRRTRLK
jgi:hypothetical protein